MGALSFKKQFIKPLQLGLKNKKGGKRQSIRNFRKRPLKVGETVYLYFGMRTKHCKKIGESVIKYVQRICIKKDHIKIYVYCEKCEWWKLDKWITGNDLNTFAKADGFKDFEDMKSFWIKEHGKKGNPFPYNGNLYKW